MLNLHNVGNKSFIKEAFAFSPGFCGLAKLLIFQLSQLWKIFSRSRELARVSRFQRFISIEDRVNPSTRCILNEFLQLSTNVFQSMFPIQLCSQSCGQSHCRLSYTKYGSRIAVCKLPIAQTQICHFHLILFTNRIFYVEQTYFYTILPQRGTSGGISEAKPARGNHHRHHHQHNSGNTDNYNHLDHHHFQYPEQESKEQLAPGQRVHPPAGQKSKYKQILQTRKKEKLD